MLFVKVGLMIFFMMWVRWTIPRFRYDQLMDLAWKSLIPLALLNLVATAAFLISGGGDNDRYSSCFVGQCLESFPVRPDDPHLKRLTPPKLSRADRFFLPQIAAGLAVTAKHMLGVVFGDKAFTVQYPEQQEIQLGRAVNLRTTPIYRGVHRLNKDEQGRVKCVACMLCATACPAHCIDIVGATAPEAPGPIARSIARALSSMSCAAFIAGCARRRVPSRRSS